MKNYHTATQEDYNALMIELENKGCMWYEEKPTAKNYWPKNEEKTYVMEENGYLTYGRMEPSYRELYSKEPFIDYKAKGENMTQEEMKQDIIDLATDVFVAVGLFARDIKFEMKKSTVEADLLEAKSSAKKLIEKIDEYLEFAKPKFKKGDIVASKIFADDSLSFVQLNQDLTNHLTLVDGIWYTKRDCDIDETSFGLFKEDTRHARQTEITEYEAALTFHKHGRKPFEVKEGDLLENKFGRYTAHEYSFSKEDFTVGGNTLLKTVEEVNEWIGADDE